MAKEDRRSSVLNPEARFRPRPVVTVVLHEPLLDDVRTTKIPSVAEFFRSRNLPVDTRMEQ